MNITKTELENKIREKVKEYVRSKEDESYLRGSASETAIIEQLYIYATGGYKKSDSDQEAAMEPEDAENDPMEEEYESLPDLTYMEQHYGLEILEVAKDSIKYYDEDKGDFIHLFNYYLKRRISMARGKEITAQMSGGMAIPERKAIIMSKARRRPETAKASEDRGKAGIDPEDMIQMLDKMREDGEISIDISIEEVSAYLAMRTTSMTNVAGEEESGENRGSILDIIGTESVEQTVESRALLEEAVRAISIEYAKTLERQRGYLKEMLTVLFIVECVSVHNLGEIISEDCAWFDWNICDTYIRTRRYPSRAEMSARYSIYEESLSRALARFLSKVDIAIK